MPKRIKDITNTAASPASDDYIPVDGATNGTRKLATTYFQPGDPLLTSISLLADPNADRIMFWDDSAGVVTWLTASTGLTISGTNMTVRTASTSQTGIAELATNAETQAGSDTARTVTPAGLASCVGVTIQGKLPSYSGNAGKTLTVNATENNVEWAAGGRGSGGAVASGSVTLTASSDAAQDITTTNYGQSVTLPDATTVAEGTPCFVVRNSGPYDLAIKNHAGATKAFLPPYESATIGLADGATAAGKWVCTGTREYGLTVEAGVRFSGISGSSFFLCDRVRIDSGRELFLFSQNSNTYGIVLDLSTNTWGSPTLIQNVSIGNEHRCKGLLIDTDKVFVGYIYSASGDATTAFRVLTFSGTTITVGSSVSDANSGYSPGIMNKPMLVGSTIVVSYTVASWSGYVQAFTVSGTTVTKGTRQGVSYGTNFLRHTVVGSALVTFGSNSSGDAAGVQTWSVSGATLTTGSTSTVPTGTYLFRMADLPNGDFVMVYPHHTNAFLYASVVKISETTINVSTVSTAIPWTTTASAQVNVDCFNVGSNKLLVVGVNGQGSNNLVMNIVTDTAGTASAGTVLTVASSALFTALGGGGVPAKNDLVRVVASHTTITCLALVDCSGSSPVVAEWGEMVRDSGVAQPDPGLVLGGRHSGAIYNADGDGVWLSVNTGLSVNFRFGNRITEFTKRLKAPSSVLDSNYDSTNDCWTHAVSSRGLSVARLEFAS